MRSVVNPRPVGQPDRTSWYYLSNPTEQLLFGLNHSHFMQRARRMRTSLVTDGTVEDMDRINGQQIPTSGTVLEMIELFIEGATISFPEPNIANIAYKRILTHMETHQRAMREDKMYEAPDPELFQHMAEFAMKIRDIAKIADEHLDNPMARKSFTRTRQALPRFSDALRATEEKDRQPEVKQEDIPAPLRRLDAIERYMELIGHGH